MQLAEPIKYNYKRQRAHMKSEPSTPCALFLHFRRVGLNNRLFRKKSAKSKAKKLEMVLRRLTRGTMTVEQTRQLQSVLGYRRQYQMQVCSSKQTFRSAVAPSQDVEEKKMVLTLLDGQRDH